MLISAIMTNFCDTKSPADQLKELRAILAAIQRESAHKGLTEVAHLAAKADEIAAALMHHVTGVAALPA